jgi:hypothetical protein
VILQEFLNAWRHLGTLGRPVIRTLGIEAQTFFTTGGYRVKKTNTLDITTVPAITAIGYHNVVKGALLGAAA